MSRPDRRDAAIAGAVTALGLAEALAGGIGDGAPAGAGGTVAAVVAGLSLLVRRSHPRAGWVVALAVLALLIAVPGDLLIPFFAVLYHVFNAGERDGGRASWLAGAGALLVSQVPASWVDTRGYGFAFLAPLLWFAGRALRERELLASRLAERAAELEAEREAYAALSVRYERARIAADLHDIVAHALSVMVVQAGAGQRLAGVDDELAAETFAAISESARQAEQDMGRLVALLGEVGAIGPAPDLGVVEQLVQRAAGSGLDVRLRLEGDRDGLPAEVVEAACRVVQESLTNALRYASGAAVQVLVRGEPDALMVEIANAAAPADAALAGAGTGNGLRGLRERVGACGGRFEAGPVHGGGWSVSACLPRRAPVPAAA
jgi:signal transduction histidine kinase